MNNIIKNFFFLLIICCLFACRDDNGTKFTLNYLPIENNEDNTYALWGSDGNIFDSKFKESPTPVINGYFAIEEDNGLTLCKFDGNNYVRLNVKEMEEVGIMNEGLIPTCKANEHIQVVNENGDIAFTLDSINGVEVEGCFSYVSGRMRVKMADGTFTYIDKDGTQIIPQFYDWCTDYDGEYAVICVEDDTYALINLKGEQIFTFDSKDYEKIAYSPRYNRLSTADNDGRIIIYDLEGKQICIYPSKVESVVMFCDDAFIFENDESYGLMSYNGEELIRAKYEMLVPNGSYFLAIHEDEDEEVKLIDKKGNILKNMDGEEIYSFKHLGFDFPNVIIRPDDEIYIVDELGEVVGKGSINYDFDIDDIADAGYVRSLYFPQESVLTELMKWCGQGSGLPEGQGTYFYKNGDYCYPQNVSFIKNATDKSIFNGKYETYENISQGLNYKVDFGVCFNQCIAYDGILNSSAFLSNMVIMVNMSDIFSNAAFFNVCKNKLVELGCTVNHEVKNDYVLISNNRENIILLYHDSGNSRFFIRVYQNNDNTISYLSNWLDNRK